MRYALVAVTLVVTTSASAMGPSATDFPPVISLKNCQKWAAAQDGEVKEFWGLLTSGKNSTGVAVMRLTLNCLGDDQPEIINFGASVGAGDQYCQTHARVPICRNRR